MVPNTFLMSHLLSALIFVPLIFGVFILLLPLPQFSIHRTLSLLGSLATLFLGILVFQNFSPENGGLQFSEIAPWIPSFGIAYFVSIDGISLPLVMLTLVITPVAILAAWPKTFESPTRSRAFSFLVMALESAVLGSFLAQDLFLFYIFWEAVLIPMYFLIGVWGGKERIYATLKFFLFTLFGSLLMLVALFFVLHNHQEQAGFASASLPDLLKFFAPFDPNAPGMGLFSKQGLLFAAFALAFAIKVPMFPLHTWLPDAHVQAPTLGSVFLAAVLLKMGTYGFLRFAIPMFPEAATQFAPVFMALGAIGVVYGALVALAQDDFKKLVAYSSVSHMGFIVMGIFSQTTEGRAGALMQMVNHGISTSGLFLIVGFLYERRHTRLIQDFGGIAKPAPLLSAAFLILSLSSAALPGTNGFTGEFPILLGSFSVFPWITGIAGLGVILGALYLFRTYERIALGPLTNTENAAIHDLVWDEVLAMGILVALVFAIGLFPQWFFQASRLTLEGMK